MQDKNLNKCNYFLVRKLNNSISSTRIMSNDIMCLTEKSTSSKLLKNVFPILFIRNFLVRNLHLQMYKQRYPFSYV